MRDFKADLLLKGGNIVNVFSAEVYPAGVAVYKGRIAGIGDYEAKDVIDLKGKYLCPGFIDSYIHLESSMLHPAEFSRAAVPHGTTAAICDPGGVASVLGTGGIKYLIDASRRLPLDFFFEAGDLKLSDKDPECRTFEEAREKLRLGMMIKVREGSSAKNLGVLIELLKNPERSQFLMFCTGDIDPEELQAGHINRLLQKACSLGISPITALQMATINPARAYRLTGMGAIAPNYFADLAVLDDLKDFRVSMVFKRGELVANEGKPLFATKIRKSSKVTKTVRSKHFEVDDLSVRQTGKYVKVIELVPGEITTRSLVAKYTGVDLERDILKLVVVERHRGSGRMAIGFVKGFGMVKGAIAQSIAHGSHNIICVGKSDEDIASAVRRVVELQGGIVVVGGGMTLAQLPLPVAGLMSDEPLETVVKNLKILKETARGLGCRLENPFSVLSFLALPVIPELRLTDRGLIDVNKFKLVDLFE